MDSFEDEEEEASLLEHLHDVTVIKDLSRQQKSRALIMATRQQNIILARALLNHGANPNEEDEFGCTPVMFAAIHGLDDCLKNMLSLPVCIINKRSHSMFTALHFAAEKGQLQCVELLLNNGAVINVADDWGETPIMLAVKAGSLDAVKLLLHSGARLDMNNLKGMDALMYAAQGGHKDIIQLLLKHGCPVNKVLKSSPLHQAAVFGHVECVQLLLNAGARSDVRDVHGILPIELATRTDKHRVVQCFLQDGVCKEYQNLALAAAAKSNGIHSVHTLLQHGADAGAVDMQGLPAFFWAVAQNNIEIVKCFIRYNVDINKTMSKVYVLNSELGNLTAELDLDFVSAVVIAALRDYDQLVKILVQAGASCQCILKLWEQESLPQALSTNTRLISLLAYHAVHPRSLAFLCRVKIREQLCFSSCHSIRELPLPKPIQDLLEYADLDDI